MENDYEQLLGIIQKDDVKAFSTLMEKANLGVLKFGRFPVLSIIYLYKAKKIAALYEEKFIKINSYIQEEEFYELSSSFRNAAGKTVRYYLEESVSPIEMLVILGQTSKVKKLFSDAHPSPSQKERMQKVYSLKYSAEITYDGNDVFIEKRPLTVREKRNVFIAALSAVLCIAIIVATPFVVNIFVPFIGVKNELNEEPEIDIQDPEKQNTDDPSSPTDVVDDPGTVEPSQELETINVTSYSQINLSASDKKYVLGADIVIDTNLSEEKAECSFDCNGHTVSAVYFPIFKEVTGTFENAVINVNRDLDVSGDFGFIAEKNSGTIKNVTINYWGTITVDAAPEKGDPTDVYGFVKENEGEIDGCILNVEAEIYGTLASETMFSGIAALNLKNIRNCTVSGEIIAQTADVAGVCSYNTYYVAGCENKAAITQNAVDVSWSPIIGGIAATNCGTIKSCVNSSPITITSSFEESPEYVPTARCAGITVINKFDENYNHLPSLNSCANTGKISADVVSYPAYASGITCFSEYLYSAQNSAPVTACVNSGEIKAKSSGYSAYASGVTVYYPNNNFAFTSCENSGNVTAESGNSLSSSECKIIAAGIAGLSFTPSGSGSRTYSNTYFTDCSSSGKIVTKLDSSAANGYSMCASGIVGVASAVRFANCTFSSSITCVYDKTETLTESKSMEVKAGGIAGFASGSNFVNCSYAEGTVSVSASETDVAAGGIAGYAPSSAFNKCSSSASFVISDISEDKTVFSGGIAGQSTGENSFFSSTSIMYCTSSTSISLSGVSYLSYVGGIAGQANSNTVYSCSNSGNISSSGGKTVVAGGIVGQGTAVTKYYTNDGSNKNTGNVTITNASSDVYAGGIAGYLSGQNGYSVNEGNVSVGVKEENAGKIYAGGITGIVRNNVTYVTNKGKVTVSASDGSTSYVGGITGISTYNAAICYSSADVRVMGGKTYAGGIVGYADFSTVNYRYVQNCVFEGTLKIIDSNDESFAGGITGFASNKSDNNGNLYTLCLNSTYSLGSVTAETENEVYVGAVSGRVSVHASEDENFTDNFFSSDGLHAVGTYQNDDETYSDGDDSLGQKYTEEEITAIANYINILYVLGLRDTPAEENTDNNEQSEETPEENNDNNEQDTTNVV